MRRASLAPHAGRSSHPSADPTPRARAVRALGASGVIVVAAACGSSQPPARSAAAAQADRAPVPAASTARSAVATPSVVVADPAGPAGTRAPGAPAAGQVRRTTAPGDPPLPSGLPSSAPLRLELGATCVTPGAEQRLVVETVPQAFVAFDNLYPDGRTGAVHGGAEAAGRSDADGRFTTAWRIAPTAPLGRVRIDVGVSARSGSAISMAYYRLAASCS